MYSVVKYACMILCLLIKFEGVACSSRRCIFDYRLFEFDGKSVSDFQLATFSNVGTTRLCRRRCSTDRRCRSYRYNIRTKTCSTYGSGFSLPTRTLNNVTDEDGSRLYAFCGQGPSFGLKCDTSSNCDFGNSTCVDGVCECVPGTSYDVTSGCNAYGCEFSTYENSGVHGCNTEKITSTFQACIAACKAEAGFVCINVEYYHDDGECNLCDSHPMGLPEDNVGFGTEPGWSLAVRHCAV